MKKNTSRKVLSMALAMVMSLTLCVPAFAVNFTENNSTKTLIENSLIKTEYEDIYKCTSGKYVMKADENTYLVMEKEDIPFSSETFTAPDYTNPWQAAYDNMFLCKYEPVEVTAGNARFVFNSI